MHEINPYEAPASPPQSVRNPRRFDAGFLTACYLRIIGGLWILALLVELLNFGRFNLDLTPALLFWAAYNLSRHGNRTRKLIISLCILSLAVDLILLVVAVAVGTDQMEISFPGTTIRNPAVWQAALSALMIAVAVGVPLWLLLSPEARREFKTVPVE